MSHFITRPKRRRTVPSGFYLAKLGPRGRCRLYDIAENQLGGTTLGFELLLAVDAEQRRADFMDMYTEGPAELELGCPDWTDAELAESHSAIVALSYVVMDVAIGELLDKLTVLLAGVVAARLKR